MEKPDTDAEQAEVAEILARVNAVFDAASSPKVYLWAVGQFVLGAQSALDGLEQRLHAGKSEDAN